MSSAGLYKLDDGETYLANCFPVRSFFQQSKEGAGHWLVAHRNAIEQKYRRLPGRNPDKTEEDSVVSGSTKRHESGKAQTNVLDGSLLMTLHRVDKPSDLRNVDVSDQKLHAVKMEDFEEFDHVVYINASENHLTLEPFSRFPILRELELSLNGLYNLRVSAGVFPHLEILDLSYNNLCSDDVLSLGVLPCLRVLHLSGNDLQTLPENMATRCLGSAQLASDQDIPFCTLEVLMLDDNKLCSPGVFFSLAGLRKLQHLNLQGNCITGVPYLQQVEDLQDAQNLSNKSCEEQVKFTSPSERLETNNKSVERSDLDIPDFPRLQLENNKSGTGENCAQSKTCCPLNISIAPDVKTEFKGEFYFPLPELKFLNLADNRIAVEEALLAVALFPSLSELVIHSNPLTTQRSGDPPLLTHFLQERLGIKIRHKQSSHMVKPRILIPVNPERKVKTKIRKVPKLPLKLEADCSSFSAGHGYIMENNAKDFEKNLSPPECNSLESSDCSSQMSTREHEEAQEPTSDDDLKTLEEKDKDLAGFNSRDGDTFFITQVDDLDKSTWQVKSDELEPDNAEKREEDLIPEKFRGYEILLDAKPDPNMFEPVGIQQTVRALELALKNLLVYRDSKANLESLQKSYTPKEKRVSKLPPPKPRRLKEEKVADVLTQMKDRKTLQQLPLDKVLKGKDVYKKEYEEALTLLSDMKKKYQVVHMKAVEGAAQIQHEKQANLDGKKANQE